jgi:hypothetical protein
MATIPDRRAEEPVRAHGSVNTEGFAAVLPLWEGQEDDVRQHLRTIPNGRRSPFASVPGTHFARLTLVPRLRDRNDNELRQVPFCLFFAAEFDMFVRGYLEMLCTSLDEQADGIFGRCVGYPGTRAPAAFVSWMLQHRVPAGFSFHGNPGATADEVASSLELRERIIAFAVETRGLEPTVLKERWVREEWDRQG